MNNLNLNRFKLTIENSLFISQLREIKQQLHYGAICILPSDTGFSAAALPFNIEAVKNLRILLPYLANAPLSLSFGSLKQIEAYVNLTENDYKLIDEYCPGPITLVCSYKSAEIKEKLNHILLNKNTLGIRMTDSNVERQISIELESPITTAAIRDSSGHIVQNFDLMVDVIKARLKNIDKKPSLVFIRRDSVKYPDQSTVIGFSQNPFKIDIYREGCIDSKNIIKKANSITFYNIEDFT